MFRKIKDLFQPPAPTGFPYNLSKSQVEALKRLAANDDWEVYRQTLDDTVTLIGDALLASRDSYHDALQKGIILGIRRAGTLVDEITLKERDVAEAERRQQPVRQPSPADRRAATFGSPFWAGASARAAQGKP